MSREQQYQACATLHPKAKPARQKHLCGCGHLSAIRNADLYGLPFVGIALVLFVGLTEAAGRPEGRRPFEPDA